MNLLNFIIVVLPRSRVPFHVAELNGDIYHIIAAFEERADAEIYRKGVQAKPRKETKPCIP
jgi:hypothetical protein